MTVARWSFTLALAVLLPAAAPAAEPPAAPADKAATPKAEKPKNAVFEQLKALEGTWAGTYDGHGTGEVSVVYKVTAAGSAVEETLFPGTPHEMVTMYHMDGDAVVLTHYCAAGNQPHMKLEPGPDPRALSFKCTGTGTNMKESDMHMHAARLTIEDADHLEGRWSSLKDGQPAGEVSMKLARKK